MDIFKRILSLLLTTTLLLGLTRDIHAQGRKLTFEEIMQFEDISDPVISANGRWVAYSVWPDRGDGEVRVRSTDGKKMYVIERGKNPQITREGNWAGAYVQPPVKEQMKAKRDKPRQGAALLKTSSGEIISFDSVQTLALSNDGRWAAIQKYRNNAEKEDDNGEKVPENGYLGTELVLKSLEGDTEIRLPAVSEFAFDSTSVFLAYSVADSTGAENGIFYRSLADPGSVHEILRSDDGYFSNLSWDNRNRRLAFTSAQLDSSYIPGEASLHVWEGKTGTRKLLDDSDANPGWTLRSNNNLQWTRDGGRLFFGFIPDEMADLDISEDEPDSTGVINLYDREEILEDVELDVWHWDDPRIKPHEKETWEERKNNLYKAVYHLSSDRWIQLADREMPEVEFAENPDYALGSSDIPYLKEMTWNFFFVDYYVVDLQTGERIKVAKKLRFGAELSPGGRYLVYYEDKQWRAYNIENEIYRNLTEELDLPFYDEDHDYPYPPPGYGIGGWVEDDAAVLIYDKYDIWQFPLDGGEPVQITEGFGRNNEMIFRIEDLDPDRQYFEPDEELLLQSYHDKKKHFGFYTARIGETGVDRRLEEEKKFEIVAQAENDDQILYTRESYREYPNLWVSNGISFKKVRRVSELHLDVARKYAWGTAELVEWNSLDGTPLQGVLIKPGHYEKGKRYPLLIYYYRFFSQRLYDFNVPRNNHRPVFAQYASDGYAVFLPDIRFEVGTPGFAATESLVPGVQKLVDMGIADPDGLGLHGHSWSGYQTAFMITQTDIFDAAVAGAPVSNMTSAYSGIRWGSGLARQFQYEQTQSRIGGSLWEYPERYIENSPVFFADRITTPLLIQFGDEDGAVPWYQGIELYLAMRRLGKDAVFLQYHGEPHHLQKYPNKLDYAIRMKEYFDHYLKGEPAPKWITDGVPYKGVGYDQ